MRTLHLATVFAAATLLTLTGCSSSSPKAATDVQVSPAPGQQATYLAALNAIDPEIVNGKDDKAISRGLDQCTAMKTETNPNRRVTQVEERFISPHHPGGFGPAKSSLILGAVQKNLCPTL
ncbi:hypothetical protein [Streptomyces sp. NBC_01276]|uniref:hypothetical protein n=1 Tax=Streptomyces sp. NBC_01276 TaxID=2903808 RepID=UPI002F91B666